MPGAAIDDHAVHVDIVATLDSGGVAEPGEDMPPLLPGLARLWLQQGSDGDLRMFLQVLADTGRSATTEMPSRESSCAGPMPDRSKSAGVCNAPAVTMTSLAEMMRDRAIRIANFDTSDARSVEADAHGPRYWAGSSGSGGCRTSASRYPAAVETRRSCSLLMAMGK